MNVSLVKPTLELQNEYLNFYQEWKDSGENMVPLVISKDPSDFHGMVQFLIDSEKGVNLPEGWVPDSTYWLVTENKKRCLHKKHLFTFIIIYLVTSIHVFLEVS